MLAASAEELAAMCAQGRLKLREADTAFDDAMQPMFGRLKAATAVAASRRLSPRSALASLRR